MRKPSKSIPSKSLPSTAAHSKPAAKPVAATTASSAAAQSADATVSAETIATPNAGLTALVTELSSFLDRAEARLGPAPTVSTNAQKRHVVKPRKGSEKVLAMIAPIVQQHGLESPSLNTQDMLERHQTAETLTPLQTRLDKVNTRVNNELFNARSDAWSMGLQFYSLLKRRSKNDGELAANLEPLTKVFAYRHPDVKASKATKVQTRAKAKLKDALELAQRHGVGQPESAPMPGGVPAAASAQPASSAPVGSVTVSPPAVAAVAAPVAPIGASPVVAAGTPAAPVSSGGGGVSGSGH